MIKSYVINLKQDVGRMEVINARFQELDLPFTRIDAVDGRLMSNAAFDAFVKARQSKEGGWGRGQAGCFLSHYMVWTEIAQGTAQCAAIFEDDVHLARSISVVFKDDLWLPDLFDIVRLETSTNRVLLDRRTVHQWATVHCTGCGRRAGAPAPIFSVAKGLEKSSPFHRHAIIASITFYFLLKNNSVAQDLIIYQISPALATQDKFLEQKNAAFGFTSNIEAHSLKDRICVVLKKLTPLVLYKSFRGFKRVRFQP